MNKLKWISLVLSLVIHGALFISLLTQPHSLPPSATQPFQLLLEDKPISTQKQNSSKKRISQKKIQQKKIDLNLFKPRLFNNNRYSEKEITSDSSASYQASQEGDVNQTMNEMSLSEYSGNRLFFEIIRSQFDQAIQYPQELVEHNIQGKTWIKILINHKGQLLQIIDASSSQPALKAFTIIGTYQALKKTISKKYWYKPERNLTLQLNFDFRIYTFGNQQSRAESSYYKNRFDFLRVQNGTNIVEKFIVDNARYIPPILPLPGGFFFSFTQTYNFIKAWSELDPKMRRLQRLEMTKEKLDTLMQKVLHKDSKK